MILKKCPKCNTYNLTSNCRKCSDVVEQSETCKSQKTKDAHYRFFGLRDAPTNFKRR